MIYAKFKQKLCYSSILHSESEMLFCLFYEMICVKCTYLLYYKACVEKLRKGPTWAPSFHLENGTDKRGYISVKYCGMQPWIGPISILTHTTLESITRSIFVFYKAALSLMKNNKTIYNRF